MTFNDYIVRKALLTDAEDIYNIEQACFSDPWSINMVFESLLNESSNYIVVEKDEVVIAAGGFEVIVGQGHIMTMGVLPKFQGMGYGSILMKELMNIAEVKNIREITLEVRVSNEKAISLYEKFEFKNYGIRKKYYIDNNEDAYIMWRIK